MTAEENEGKTDVLSVGAEIRPADHKKKRKYLYDSLLADGD